MTMNHELVSVLNIYHSTVNEFTRSRPISKLSKTDLDSGIPIIDYGFLISGT